MEAAMASGALCCCSPSIAPSSPASVYYRARAFIPPWHMSSSAVVLTPLSPYVPPALRSSRSRCPRLVVAAAALDALIFDCDGVILESEDLHRLAYNATFAHFDVRLSSSSGAVDWTSDFYDQLQNQIGGGKPKMRWYFNQNGWPSSSISAIPPESQEDREKLIDVLQAWKTEKYKDIIRSGAVSPRPGVLRLMDDARESGKRLAVCSAATKSSVVFCLENLLGDERFRELDCFLAGDDVDKKKPDPSIYVAAAQKLGVAPENSLVIEDSVIGLQAALGAGMGCVISFTSSTSKQDFSGAKAVYPNLGNVSLEELEKLVGAVHATI